MRKCGLKLYLLQNCDITLADEFQVGGLGKYIQSSWHWSDVGIDKELIFPASLRILQKAHKCSHFTPTRAAVQMSIISTFLFGIYFQQFFVLDSLGFQKCRACPGFQEIFHIVELSIIAKARK